LPATALFLPIQPVSFDLCSVGPPSRTTSSLSRTPACLDRDQLARLHAVFGMKLMMNRLRLEQQRRQRHSIDGSNFIARPVVTRYKRGGGPNGCRSRFTDHVPPFHLVVEWVEEWYHRLASASCCPKAPLMPD